MKRLNGKVEIFKAKWSVYLKHAYSTETGATQKRTERKRFLDASLDFEEVLCIGSSNFISLETILHLRKNKKFSFFFFKYINK